MVYTDGFDIAVTREDDLRLLVHLDGTADPATDTALFTVKKHPRSTEKLIEKEFAIERDDYGKLYVEMVLTHAETPEEFADRIRADILARPGFYFQRREVTVTEDQIAAFSLTEAQMAKQIVGTRQDGRDAEKRGVPYCAAFMQNVGQMTCQHCDYEAICMSGKTISPDKVPDGFKYTGATPELSNK